MVGASSSSPHTPRRRRRQAPTLQLLFFISLSCMLFFGLYSWSVLGIHASRVRPGFLRQLPSLHENPLALHRIQRADENTSISVGAADAYNAIESTVGDQDTSRSHEAQTASQGLLDPHRFELPSFESIPLVKTGADLRLEASINESCVKLDHVEKAFAQPGKCISRQQLRETIIDLVLTVTSVFASYGIATFLESGTLLGSYRHQTIIPYDVDADLGIDETGFQILQTTNIEFPSPKYYMEVFEGQFNPSGVRFAELPARVIDRDTGLYLDIFVYNEWPNEVFEDPFNSSTVEPSEHNQPKSMPLVGPLPSGCYISCAKCPRLNDPSEEYVMKQFHVPYDWVYPLADCMFAGKMLKCPREPAKYLEYMFGEDYMQPVPYYVAFNADGTADEAPQEPTETI